MNIDLEQKLIVCLLPHGKGLDLVERLNHDKGIVSANVTSGRGQGTRETLETWIEVDVLAVTVSAERANEIFEFLYDAAGIGVPNGGLIFQQALAMASAYALPEVTEVQGAP